MEEAQTQRPKTVAQSYAIPFAIIIAGLAIASAVYFSNNKNGLAAGEQAITTIESITNKDHVLGNPDAKIVIVEYSDTECPACKAFQPILQQVINEYGASGDVAWVYRHFPLSYHTKAAKEAEATECAAKLGGNAKFWEFINKVFEITPANNGLDPAELPKIAESIGLDVTAFNKCLESGEMKQLVDANIASGQKAGVNATPYPIVLVNKKVAGVIGGALPFEDMKKLIDEALKRTN